MLGGDGVGGAARAWGAVLIIDGTGRIRAASEEAQRLLASPLPLVGEQLTRVVRSEDAARLRRHLDEAGSSRSGSHCDLSLGGISARPRWIRMQSSAYFERGERFVVAILWDVTDLGEALTRQTAMFDAALDAILLVDERGKISTINAAAVDMFGYSEEEIAGENVDLLIPAIAGGDGAEPISSRLEAAIGSIGECSGRRRDGTTFTIEIAIGGRDETPRLYTLTVRDLSDRKRRAQAHTQSVKLEALRRLAGGAAYDFHRLLEHIGGGVRTALDELDDPQTARDCLEEVIAAAASGASIADNLLAHGRTAPRPTSSCFDDVLADSEEALRRLLGEGVLLQIRPGASSARLGCARDQLDRLLATLVASAREAIGKRGRLEIETARVSLPGESPRDQPSVAEPGRYLVLTVTKTDLDPDEKARSYPFGSSFRRSSAYDIVEQQRGFLQIRSDGNGEATLRVYLPCVDDRG